MILTYNIIQNYSSRIHDQLKLRPCFLPEFQKIDGAEYLRKSTDFAIFLYY